MSTPYESIKEAISAYPYDDFEHEPVYTSEQAAEQRADLTTRNGAKSILVKHKNGFNLLVTTGDSKLSSSKVRKLLGIKEFRFATPEEVVEQMGCEIGACYPFGNLIDVEMFVDQLLATNEKIAFNPGVHSRTIVMNWSDYESAVRPKMADIAKDPED